MGEVTSGDLAARLGGHLRGRDDVVVRDLTHDSRQVEPGWAFGAVHGLTRDGSRYVPEALRRGASVVIVEEPHPDAADQIVVDNVRTALGPAASMVHGDPSLELEIVGVTGTNGKTTVVALMESILVAAGRTAATIGTLTAARTTPEAPDLQRRFRQWIDEGIGSVAMEVSSHALDLHRVDGTHFDVGVFTNLGDDHLDYHQNRERYFAAKASLFDPQFVDVGVFNIDDVHGRLLSDSAPVEAVSYSLDQLDRIRVGRNGSEFEWRGHGVTLRLPGRFNMSNALAAAEAARLLGVEDAVIAAALSSAASPPGRFESVVADQPFAVIVDYAHTPDALTNVLEAARELGSGTLRVVMGAGGDRDSDKRSRMGSAATSGADEVIVTTDNPRWEDPAAIMDAVVSGCSPPPVVIADRREAIAYALDRSTDGDVVVIAGKGHETTQTVQDREIPFDDRTVARHELARLGYERPAGQTP